MDIITHTFSGLLFGSVAAAYIIDNGTKKAKIIISGGIGGCLPDIDAISLWSGFDSTIGKLFHLSLPGHEIYFSKFWYSHHGFFHSIAAIFGYILIFGLLKNLISPSKKFISSNYFELIAFAGGYFIHILEDMPTPSGSWGGVNIFWPSNQWLGGTGQIWWWNNYDIFLIIAFAFLLNLIVLIIASKLTFSRPIIQVIFFIAVSFSCYQINTRPVNFNHSGVLSEELDSLEIQQKILGETVYNMMVEVDEMVKINF